MAPRKEIGEDPPVETSHRKGRARRAGLNPEVSLVGQSEAPVRTESADQEPVRRQRRGRREQAAEVTTWAEEPVPEFTERGNGGTLAEHWDDELVAEAPAPRPQPEKIIPPSSVLGDLQVARTWPRTTTRSPPRRLRNACRAPSAARARPAAARARVARTR